MSRTASDLAVDSVTGIDVTLAVAGPGARCYAFTIDWNIRLLLAFAWYAGGAFLYNGALTLNAPAAMAGSWFALVLLPAAAIYFLYHYVLELALRGRTPGKRMAGVRVVTRDGGPPGAGQLLLRNVFRLIDCLPVCYGVGLTAVTLTREHVRVGDMAAGTLLVYERSAAPPVGLAPTGALDAAGAEIVEELLARWPQLEAAARARLARQVLARYAGASQPPAAGPAEEAELRRELERLLRP